MAAHIAPEAVRGGPIAALSDGDRITIDVERRRIDADLSDAQISKRCAAYVQPRRADEHIDVAVRKYARLVGSAAEGAVTS
jgi:dihydroxy-acid dehydratase